MALCYSMIALKSYLLAMTFLNVETLKRWNSDFWNNCRATIGGLLGNGMGRSSCHWSQLALQLSKSHGSPTLQASLQCHNLSFLTFHIKRSLILQTHRTLGICWLWILECVLLIQLAGPYCIINIVCSNLDFVSWLIGRLTCVYCG